mgnify:CR=1 FL=1
MCYLECFVSIYYRGDYCVCSIYAVMWHFLLWVGLLYTHKSINKCFELFQKLWFITKLSIYKKYIAHRPWCWCNFNNSWTMEDVYKQERVFFFLREEDFLTLFWTKNNWGMTKKITRYTEFEDVNKEHTTNERLQKKKCLWYIHTKCD